MHGHAAETCLLDPPIPFVQDPPLGKKVAIVGAGPAGLTCAYYLTLKGHSCKVFDMQPQPGGMLRYGIPEYRLPKDVMDRELDHVFQLGVDLQSNVKLGRDFTIDDLFAQGFDAVYLAITDTATSEGDIRHELAEVHRGHSEHETSFLINVD
ncbi:MAG: FAD-dependent oxidoreductase [Chloroflexota bacterium]|nr:FAD-dependent oxidoreductase [Chloroflexota bacterium]